MTSGPFDGRRGGPPFGHFTYHVKTDRWEWSDGMYTMHGFHPREVPATTDFLLAHKHPDDRIRTYEVLERASSEAEPFSCYHRIIDKSQRVRFVVSVGHPERGADGSVDKVTGFFIDLTEVQRTETNAEVDKALAVIAETRGVIEQAKGAVMLATGCSPEEAFEVLRRTSQHTNLKVQHIARSLVESIGGHLRSSMETELAVVQFLASLTQGSRSAMGEPPRAE